PATRSSSAFSPTAAGSTSRPTSGRRTTSSARWSAPSGGSSRRGSAGPRGARAAGIAQRGGWARALPPPGRRALPPGDQRDAEPVPLPASADRPEPLLPRGRGLRARGLPLAPLLARAPFADRRREHRPVGGEALPDPVAAHGRPERIPDRERRD